MTSFLLAFILSSAQFISAFKLSSIIIIILSISVRLEAVTWRWLSRNCSSRWVSSLHSSISMWARFTNVAMFTNAGTSWCRNCTSKSWESTAAHTGFSSTLHMNATPKVTIKFDSRVPFSISNVTTWADFSSNSDCVFAIFCSSSWSISSLEFGNSSCCNIHCSSIKMIRNFFCCN